MNNKITFAGFLIFTVCSLYSAEYYVDNVKGNDINLGTKEKPFKTIAKALRFFKGGDVLHLIPNKEAYHETIDIRRKKWAGAPDKPSVIDGHGAVISQMVRLKSDKWNSEGKGIFSRKLNNNAWVMDRQGYWSAFPIVFFNDKAAKYQKSLKELKDFTYFLFKDYPKKRGDKRGPLHNTLYIRLPEGKTPDDVKVESIDTSKGGTNFHVNQNYVIIRNITSMYAAGDGFATSRCKGILFENVRGCYNMDQGTSAHGSEIIAKNSRFDNNAGCGIVDVWPECHTKYINCIIEDDTFRGGIEFLGGSLEMTNCIIKNNQGNAFSISRGARAKLTNCVFIGNGSNTCFRQGSGKLITTNCTVYDFKLGFNLMLWKKKIITSVKNCAFIDCKEIYSWRKGKVKDIGKFSFDYNFFTPSFIKAYGEKYNTSNFNKYQETTGLDKHSIMKEYKGKISAYKSSITLQGKTFGAKIRNKK